MVRGNSPTAIKDDAFRGQDSLSPTHQKSLLVEAFNNAAEKLVPSWNKELVVMVGLTANNTNSKVANARILVQGTFNLERKTYKAANFWEFEDPAIKF